MIYIYLYVLYAHQSRTFFVPSKLNFQPQRNINNISYITICMYIYSPYFLLEHCNKFGFFGGVQRTQIDFSSESNFQMYQFSLNLEFFQKYKSLIFSWTTSKNSCYGYLCHKKSCQARDGCTLDILFLSNGNIHKTLCGLCFWASEPLIDRFYKNLSIIGSEAQKQRQHELL